MKTKITDMDDYLKEVLNPEDISGLTKKYRIQVTERSNYYRNAEVQVLAINPKEAKEFVYDNLYEYDEGIDWDSDSDGDDLDVVEINEVKD